MKVDSEYLARVRANNPLWQRAKAAPVDWAEVERRHAKQVRARTAWRTGQRTPPVPRRLRSAPADRRQYAPAQATTATRDTRLGDGAKVLLTLILAECGSGDRRLLTNGFLAQALGLSERTIQRRVAELEAMAYVQCWPELDGRGVCVGRWIAVLPPARPHWHTAHAKDADRPNYHRSMWPGRNRNPEPEVPDSQGVTELSPNKNHSQIEETTEVVDNSGDNTVNKSDILGYVEGLGVQSGTSKRFDCPSCGGKTTFSVTNDFGQLKWHCFKASCKTRGIANHSRTADEIRAVLRRNQVAFAYELPEHFTSVQSSERCLAWLTRNNAMPAYAAGRVDLRYDPKQDRVCFLVRHQGKIVNAVGRTLQKGGKPKWLAYTKDPHPFMVGSGSVAVLVEDCASATAVSGIATGIALLGTDLKTCALSHLRGFDQVIIALDPDATRKGLELSIQLRYYLKSVTVVRLPNDLKYFKESEIAAILGL